MKRNNRQYSAAKFYKQLVSMTLMLLCSYFSISCKAESKHAPVGNTKQDLSVIQQKVKEFLLEQAYGLPGDVEVSVTSLEPRLNLADCPALTFFLPNGSRAWGKTSVAVRCVASASSQTKNKEIPFIPWTIYVQAYVAVFADYLIAVNPLSQGQVLIADDVMLQRGDLAKLPHGIYTNVNKVIGSSVKVSLMAGSILRQEMLKPPSVVQQGQTVTLLSVGNGYRVSTEGRALANAIEGQIVQIKIASGQIVSGVAKSGGLIEVGF